MPQQISIDAALAAFRQKCGELVDENVLLKAHVTELEAENERLRSGEPDPHPTMTGPVAEQG